MTRLVRHLAGLALLAAAPLAAQTIGFSLTLPHDAFILGEPVKATVKIVNRGFRPVHIATFGPFKENRLFFEISPTGDHSYLRQVREGKIVTDLDLEKDEGVGLDVPLSEWYRLTAVGRYSIRAVLILDDLRFESDTTTFDIVPGIELASTRQYVGGRPPIERTLSLVYWTRKGSDVAFLRSWDTVTGAFYGTLVLGPILRIKKPSFEAVDDTTFHIYRQATRDVAVRSVILSTSNGVEIKEQSQSVDTPSSPMVDSLRHAVENAKAKKRDAAKR